MRLVMAGVSGGIGGIVGAPADMVNVRMQNDIKLPKDSLDRRNYKHAIDGLIRVMREEGLAKVFLEDSIVCRFIFYNAVGCIFIFTYHYIIYLQTLSGVEWAASRAVLLSIGQLCFYGR